MDAIAVTVADPDTSVSDETTGALVHAVVGSPLFDLRAIRQSKIEKLYKDIEVPRWSDGGQPAIWVRYRPAKAVVAQKSIERRQKAKDEELMLNSNADVLAEACIGVYAVVDGTKYSLRKDDPSGTWTKFDPDLAAALGLDPSAAKAVDVVRALFFTDGDLINAAAELGDWSSIVMPKADEEALGE